MSINILLPKQLLVIGIKEISQSKFNLIKNREDFNKPFGGLWTSPYYPNRKYKSSWHEWCEYEQPNWLSQDAVIITLKDDIKSFTINDQNDLINFINIVGEQETLISKFMMSPNYEKAASLYDTIYLTEGGQRDTRLPSKNHRFNLYGWDVETVLLNNLKCIKKWKYIKLDNKGR